MAIDIHFGKSGQFDVLSNLADKWFTFDGVQVRTIESVLQAIKIYDQDKQAEFWDKNGFWCKKAGRNVNWWDSRVLWWKGQPMDRDGEEYQEFLDRLYGAAYAQCQEFRDALVATCEQEMQHSIGTVDQERTILTVDEFLDRLYILRTVALKKPS